MTVRLEEDGLMVRIVRTCGCAEAMLEVTRNEWLSLVGEWESRQLAAQVQSETVADE